MTIKQLAELVELHTGKPMSRQNMTQRLGRDNFQEQDMRLIAEILGCKFQLSIMELEADDVRIWAQEDVKEVPTSEIPVAEELNPLESEITVGELVDMVEESEAPEVAEEVVSAEVENSAMVTEGISVGVESEVTPESQERELLKKGIRGYFKKAGNAETTKKKM